MPYTSLSALIDAFGERLLVNITDREEVPAGAVDTGVVDRALADTDALIDGYLSGRYALPMATTPPLIAALAQTIAIYKLHVYQPDPKIADDYNAALRSLRDIADGRLKLPVAGVESPGTGGTGVRITDRERPMTEGNLKGFI